MITIAGTHVRPECIMSDCEKASTIVISYHQLLKREIKSWEFDESIEQFYIESSHHIFRISGIWSSDNVGRKVERKTPQHTMATNTIWAS